MLEATVGGERRSLYRIAVVPPGREFGNILE